MLAAGHFSLLDCNGRVQLSAFRCFVNMSVIGWLHLRLPSQSVAPAVWNPIGVKGYANFKTAWIFFRINACMRFHTYKQDISLPCMASCVMCQKGIMLGLHLWLCGGVWHTHTQLCPKVLSDVILKKPYTKWMECTVVNPWQASFHHASASRPTRVSTVRYAG